MSQETRQRLMEIFAVVLDLPPEADVAKIQRDNERRWDSLAQVSIIAAIESEFGLVMDTRDQERLTSFASTEMLLLEKIDERDCV